MSEKQMNLFMKKADTLADKVGHGASFEPKSEHRPKPCPHCDCMMKPQKNATHFQICPQCKCGYNVNYNPPQIYLEPSKAKLCKPTESDTTQTGQLDNQNKAEKNSDASAIDTNNGVDGECGKYAAQSGLADHVHIPTICPMCKQDKQLQWINPGSLGPNTEICKDCVPRLFAKYGYMEPGYKIIDEETVQIFSQTTGWETVKVSWVKKIIGNRLGNDLFPMSVMLEHEQIREVSECNLDHETFGITWAAARLLSVKAGVAMPVEPSTECTAR